MNIDRETLLAALKKATDPRGYKPHEVAAVMGADEKGRHRLRKLLADLVSDGTIEKAEGARYRLVGWVPEVAAAPGRLPGLPAPKVLPGDPGAIHKDKEKSSDAGAPAGTVPGRIRVHPGGFGFVQREDGEDDVFVSARSRGAALDGDRVAIATWVGYKGIEGRVVDVLARGRARLTGTLRATGRTVYLEPDDPRIHGHVRLEGGAGAAHEGQAIVAEIVSYPTEPDAPLVARVSRVLGDSNDPRTEVAKVIACSDIPDEFPAEVIRAAERTPQTVQVEDVVDRVDLRDRDFLTIDPETARDFDDAVCVEDGPRPGIDRLWVAVADVSHYVRPGTALDTEARVRGVSVYLPNRAISMLPHALSAGICSLNPEVDRLAMVARLDIDAGGYVVDAALQAAVIRSRARLDYAGVAAALGGDLRGQRARYAEHLPHLQKMRALAGRLRKLRVDRGSLDFDIPEAVVVLDEDDPRLVRDVRKSRSQPEIKEAYRLVEDFMLAANEAVARFFHSRSLDTLWRVHAPPKENRLLEFAGLAEGYGLQFNVEDAASPKKLRDFLESLKGRPMERALSYLLLRSLKQAVYDVVNVGHFGLAAPEYLHFTSPIRRYPDLVVHRLLKNQLRAEGMPSGGVKYAPPPKTEDLAKQAMDSSTYERRAMTAEREVVDMYRAFLMRDRVGEEYEGTIVGVTAFGIFVQVEEPFIEGLVKTEKLGGDRFVYDERTVRLVAAASGVSFSLGDDVKVRIENVSVQRRKIDMVLVDHVSRAPAAPARSGEGRHGQGHGTPKKHEGPKGQAPKGGERGRGRGGGGGGGKAEKGKPKDGRRGGRPRR